MISMLRLAAEELAVSLQRPPLPTACNRPVIERLRAAVQGLRQRIQQLRGDRNGAPVHTGNVVARLGALAQKRNSEICNHYRRPKG